MVKLDAGTLNTLADIIKGDRTTAKKKPKPRQKMQVRRAPVAAPVSAVPPAQDQLQRQIDDLQDLRNKEDALQQ